MSGIAGFFHPEENYLAFQEYYENLLEDMGKTLSKRGPDGTGAFLTNHCGMVRTAFSPSKKEKLYGPARISTENRLLALAFDGELYNKEELETLVKGDLSQSYDALSEADILAEGFYKFGPDFIQNVNGVFGAALFDREKNTLFLIRDRLGVKPLFYTVADGTLIFASEPKGILAYPGIQPALDLDGLNQVFTIGPARTPGCGIFKDFKEVLPGCMVYMSLEGINTSCYWKLESRPHKDSYEETVEKTSFLIQDAVKRQMSGGKSMCSFLSGGIDSSLVSSICARELKKQNKQLTTYSFDFKDSEKHFKANAFQPSLDKPFVEKMVAYLDSDHHFLECTTEGQADLLYSSVDAHDLPNMGDVDSSLQCFCSQVTKNHQIALTGECADEIFGGYPWFHKESMMAVHAFPWSSDLEARKVLLSDDFAHSLNMEDYAAQTYEASLAQVPALEGESSADARRRQIAFLNLKWFMQTLLNRMDRAGSQTGLAARVPFADYRIVEYLWNVPWDMKARDGIVKGLLRDSAAGLLPDDILWRRKSPYPKTYDLSYEALLASRLREILCDTSSPLHAFLDKEKTDRFLKKPSDYGRPWYGQLMAAPQMIAYMIQLDYWMRKYKISVTI